MGETQLILLLLGLLVLLALLVILAFAICDTIIALAFIWVFGRMGIRHLLMIDRRSRSVAALESSGSETPREPPLSANVAETKAILVVGEGRRESSERCVVPRTASKD